MMSLKREIAAWDNTMFFRRQISRMRHLLELVVQNSKKRQEEEERRQLAAADQVTISPTQVLR